MGRFFRITETWLLPALLLTGCQNAVRPGACSSTSAVSDSKSTVGATLGGGVLTLEGESIAPGKEKTRVKARCSAFVRLNSRSGEVYRGQIWTARHCLPDFSSRITQIDLRLFDGRKGYAPTETKLPLADARAAFFDLVNEKVPEFIDPDKKQKNPARIVLDYAFLEEEGKKNYGSDCHQNVSGDSIPDSQICSALQDFRIFDAEISSKSRIGNQLLSSLLARDAELLRNENSRSLSAQWSLLAKKQMDLEADISRGRFVDMILQCAEASPSAACKYKDTLQLLARKYRAPGRDLLAEAEKDGFTQPGRNYSEFKKKQAVEHYNNQLMPVFSKLRSGIEGKSLSLNFAGNFADATGKMFVFSSAPLDSFYKADNAALQFEFETRETARDAFMKFESPPGQALVLASGDSGSALLMDNMLPFMVVSAKGKNSISGGASILVLPEPSDDEPKSMRAACP